MRMKIALELKSSNVEMFQSLHDEMVIVKFVLTGKLVCMKGRNVLRACLPF